MADADRAAIDRALSLTGMVGMADRAVDRLSGGELQRVWLATCLAQETDVLLFDEPTNHLDLRYQVETLDLIRDLADDHGTAIGVVLHDLSHAAAIADRVVLLGERSGARVRRPGRRPDHRPPDRGLRNRRARRGRPRDGPPAHRTAGPPSPSTVHHQCSDPRAHLRREPMRTRTTATILGSALLALLAACGTTQPASSGTRLQREVTSTGSASAGRRRGTATGRTGCADDTTTTATGPVSLTDAFGRTVELTKPAERVAVLEWQQIEDVLTLCVDPVAVADAEGFARWDTAETLPAGVADVGTRGEPNLDALFATNPDLVIIEAYTPDDEIIAQLAAYGVPVLATKGADAADPIGQMKDTFTLIAEATGRQERAQVVLDEFTASLASGQGGGGGYRHRRRRSSSTSTAGCRAATCPSGRSARGR